MPKPDLKTQDINLGYKEILREVEIIKGNPYVKIGVQSDAENHEDGTPMVLIASANEFGTKDGRIPERSFIRSTMDEEHERLVASTEKHIEQITKGRSTARRALSLLGLTIQSLIQKKITTLSEPPNALSTIKKKGSDNPLIDTGQMRASISYVVEMKGDTP